MLRLNRMTDYAIVILGRMAMEIGHVRTAASLAEATGVPLPSVSKILKMLAGSSLVVAHRGAKGGYSLDRPAERVTMTEIIQALEGPIALTACVDGAEDSCEVENSCFMRGNWNRVNTAIRTALDAVTLAEMLDPEEMFPPRVLAGAGAGSGPGPSGSGDRLLERGE
jgi:FeS assembly SUF system regulator